MLTPIAISMNIIRIIRRSLTKMAQLVRLAQSMDRETILTLKLILLSIRKSCMYGPSLGWFIK